MTITREEAIGLYGTPTELAKALGIKRQAVNGWGKGEPIPEKQYLKLRYELKKECFNANGRLRKSKKPS